MNYVNDLHESIYGLEGTLHSSLFDEDIYVISRDCSEDYVQLCAAAFEEMDDALINKLLSATAAYALEFVEEYGLYDDEIEWDFTENSPLRDILKYIFPVRLSVQASDVLSEEDSPAAFNMELSCVWEPEHALEWMVCGGDPIYVGGFKGCSPWNRYPGSENYINRV